MYAAQIQTGELRAQDLPTTYGEWAEYARFAVTFSPRDREGCAEFAARASAIGMIANSATIILPSGRMGIPVPCRVRAWFGSIRPRRP